MELSSSPILKLNASGVLMLLRCSACGTRSLARKKGDLAMDRELWIADYRLGFPSLSPVVANPHFVRRSERSIVPKSETMRLCGVCALCVW